MTKADNVTQAMTQGGGCIALVSGLFCWMETHYQLVGSLCAAIGVLIAFLGFLHGCYYRHKHFKLEERIANGMLDNVDAT